MMSYCERKAQLALNQVKARQIAQELNVDQSTVSRVLKGVGRSKPIEEAIAKACGKERLEMFPPNAREHTGEGELSRPAA